MKEIHIRKRPHTNYSIASVCTRPPMCQGITFQLVINYGLHNYICVCKKGIKGIITLSFEKKQLQNLTS